VNAWIEGRDHLIPEDLHAVFRETVGHRVFLQPVYELRRDSIIPELLSSILSKVTAP
jgi:hypothetical protein